MAIQKTFLFQGDEISYWEIDRVVYDGASGKTDVSLAGWRSKAIRDAKYPAAEMRVTVPFDGDMGIIVDCVAAVKGTDDWKDAIDV